MNTFFTLTTLLTLLPHLMSGANINGVDRDLSNLYPGLGDYCRHRPSEGCRSGYTCVVGNKEGEKGRCHFTAKYQERCGGLFKYSPVCEEGLYCKYPVKVIWKLMGFTGECDYKK